MSQVISCGPGATHRYFRCARKDKRLCWQKDIRCERDVPHGWILIGCGAAIAGAVALILWTVL